MKADRSGFAWIGWLWVGLAAGAGAADDPSAMAHGEYVFRIAGCAACHTPESGPALAGGRALQTPFGTFYSPNITSSPEHGIGRWTEGDFVRALSQGVSPRGDDYYPVFPYPSYTRMSGADARALFRYLSAVDPVETRNRPHDVPWYFGFRILNWFWKLLFFEPGAYQPRADRPPEWNRGAYIATALAHCGQCHTPRNALGALRSDAHLAGNPDGPEGELVPNITPDEDTGVGLWSPAELVDFLTSGALPDGDYAGGAMAGVIDEGLQYLRPADVQALVTYIRSVPARPETQ